LERGPALLEGQPEAEHAVSKRHTPFPQSGYSATDTRLIRDCLAGSEQAWSNLIDRYKNLIFSVPIKTGILGDDATDIFQAVCLDLLTGLPKLKRPEALPRWLIQVTYHKCLRWKADRARYSGELAEVDGTTAEFPDDCEPVPDELLYESERSQRIRQVLAELEPRCRQLVQTLFFETPPRPYREVAQNLSLSVGSIGAVRERCLQRLRRLLEKAGLG
jgi:RNA polymerase sigma factor (sigma-70 family)